MITYYSVSDLFYVSIWRHYFYMFLSKFLFKTLTLKSIKIYIGFFLLKYYRPFLIFVLLKSLTAKYVSAIGLFFYYESKTSIFWYQRTYLSSGQAYICFTLLLMFCWRANFNAATFFFLTPLAANSCKEILHKVFFWWFFSFLFPAVTLTVRLAVRDRNKRSLKEWASCCEFRRWQDFLACFLWPMTKRRTVIRSRC